MHPLLKAIGSKVAKWQGRKAITALCLAAGLWSCAIGGWIDRQVQIDEDGRVMNLTTRRWTVGGMLAEAGISVNNQDLVSPATDTFVWPGLAVTISRALPVTVEYAGQRQVVTLPSPTVGSVLGQQGITLQPGDRVDTNLGSGQDNLYVRVVNRREEIKLVQETLPFSEKRRPHYRLVEGSQQVLQEGKEGLKVHKYRVVKENGVEVRRELLESRVEAEPRSRIVAYGTREWPTTAARVGQELEVLATAYTHTGDPTCTGIYPYVGVVAVDPSVIPLGAKLYVEGYGYADAQDTGGLIKGRRIDVFLDTEREAIHWGVKRVKVKIVGL